MKQRSRIMLLAIAFGLIAGLALIAWIRLAPVDVARWHVALPTDDRTLEGACADHVTTLTAASGGQAACSVRELPQALLQRLDALALATAGTRRIAGSPQEGRITWESRSRVFGFPDYTTAQARRTGDLTRLDIAARQRFGRGDMGVNAARLKDWLARL